MEYSCWIRNYHDLTCLKQHKCISQFLGVSWLVPLLQDLSEDRSEAVGQGWVLVWGLMESWSAPSTWWLSKFSSLQDWGLQLLAGCWSEATSVSCQWASPYGSLLLHLSLQVWESAGKMEVVMLNGNHVTTFHYLWHVLLVRNKS